jgi:glycosyltransferase involved in cell wall biosynthesis
MRALYLCYFGLREPLVQTQVVPYLRQLVKGGHQISLLTFEPGWPHSWAPDEIERQRQQLAAEGISWQARRYHKRPSLPATLWDILQGLLFIVRMNRDRRLDILHARSHVPLAMALLGRWLTGAAVIFDLRGLIADEYVDAGVWRHGSIVYRAMKRLEHHGLRRADWLVVLTEKMSQWVTARRLRPEEEMTVIPCCIDEGRFEPASAPPSPLVGAEPVFELIYAGSVTGLYLLEEMGALFEAFRQRVPAASLRLLTATNPAEVLARLENAGTALSGIEVEGAVPALVPRYLARASVGLSFRKPTFSQIAASPTKIPEYLRAGLPVITNAGIGDTDRVIEQYRVGVVVRELTPAGYAAAVEQLLDLLADPTLRERCRQVATIHFDLEQVGGARYREVYRALAAGRPQTDAGSRGGRRKLPAVPEVDD